MDNMMGKPSESHYDWADLHAAYHSPPMQSPAHEYAGYGFAVSPHDLTPDSPYGRHPAQMYPSSQQPQPVFPTQWPSMLTSASMQQHPHQQQQQSQPQAQQVTPTQHQPPAPAQAQIQMQPPLAPLNTMTIPQSVPPQMNPQPPQTQTPPARRTLTDQDRRRMCQYHEDNPSVKQTEIGAMFGVERSTVSKVLRQKEKYLFPDDGSRSPVKKAKGKFPDIERALSNWVKNHERKGLVLSDKDIREKARFFAATVGSVDSYDKLNSSSWLEKFKQKNGLAGTKGRKASDANESDVGNENESGVQTPSGISPTSPSGVGASPISSNQNMEHVIKTEGANFGPSLATNYNRSNSQSATSLSAFNDAAASSKARPQSPGSSFYSADISGSGMGFGSTQPSQMMMNATTNARNRRQTFPVLGMDTSFNQMPAMPTTNLTPKQIQDMTGGQTLGTPIEEYPERSFSLSSADVHHVSQPGSGVHSPAAAGSPALMAPPPNPMTPSATASPIGPPSQDEARRAMELVMHFFQHQPNGVVDAEEYITMGKLMEKLKVQGSVGELPGGMRSLESSQHEVSRKRSIHSL